MKLFFLLLVTTICLGQQEELPMIVLDLGGVVFKEPEYFAYDTLPPEIQEKIPSNFQRMRIFLRAFDFVHLITHRDLKEPWLLGKFSGKEVVDLIHANIDKPEYASFFQNEYEQLLIKYGAQIMFIPDQLAHWSIIYPEALTFATACKEKGMRLFILSNWDPESLKLLKKVYPAFFNLFEDEDIFTPHRSGYAKPHLQAYDYLIKDRNLDPHQVIFIDDSKTNINAAQAYGLKSILHTDWATTEHTVQTLLQRHS